MKLDLFVKDFFFKLCFDAIHLNLILKDQLYLH